MPTEPTEIVVLKILVVGAAIAALVAVLLIYLLQAGRNRSSLASAAVALSLIGPVCGIAAASKHLTQTFDDMARSGEGGATALVAGCTRAQNLMRLGNGAAVITLALAAGLGWLGARPSSRLVRPQASTGRTAWLLALLILPVVAVGTLHEYARTTNRIAVGVAEAPTAKAGDPGEGPLVVQALVSRMTRGLVVGLLGSLVVLAALFAFAVISTVVAWGTAASPSFTTAGTVLLLMVAALAVAGTVLFDRPILLPR